MREANVATMPRRREDWARCCTACDDEASSPLPLRATHYHLPTTRYQSQIANATNRKSTLLCVPCVAFALFALKLPTIIYHLPTTIYRLMKRKGFRFSLGTCDAEASSPHRLRANSIANRKSVNRKFNLPTTIYPLPTTNYPLSTFASTKMLKLTSLLSTFSMM